MSLSELIAGVEAHEQTLTVFNADESVIEDLRSRFSDRNVSVVGETTGSGRPGEFLTLSDEDGVSTATDLDAFYETLDRRDRVLGGDTAPILGALDETLFTSWSIKRMVTASREIEDRAWRVGHGALHAGFQTLSTLEGELDLYERLGDSAVEVHAYAVPDTDPPAHHTFHLHLDRSEEIANSWFVVFDDGSTADDPATQKCALLAEERDPREFYGFWTYDPATVDYIVDHLERRYGMVEQ